MGLDSTFDQVVLVLSSCDTTTSVAIQCSHPEKKKSQYFSAFIANKTDKDLLELSPKCFWIERQRTEPSWLWTEAEQRNTGSASVMLACSDLLTVSSPWKFLNSGSVAQPRRCSLAYNLTCGCSAESKLPKLEGDIMKVV